MEIEIARMWNTKKQSIPIIVGALGTVKTGANNYLKQILGQQRMKEIQKRILLGMTHVLRQVLVTGGELVSATANIL